MTQLILDAAEYNIAMPESKKGGYRAERRALSVDVEMITGRLVRELRGTVWVISYQYGYFDDDLKNRVLAACEKGRRTPITCGFLPQESAGTLSQSQFFVTSYTRPKFMWGRGVLTPSPDGGYISQDVPLWGDFSVELREVKPSD